QGKFSLSQLYSLLRKCNIFVTGDTGPMHMAVAVGTPALVLFGSTSPSLAGPLGKQHRTLYFPDAAQTHSVEKEPNDTFKEVRHPSFEPITAELVFQNVQEMLSEKQTQE
ncbi:MAG: glycosyltransferase family 9 protein, partial [Thermoguttaceae bacterium]